jgi:hypothetical protein
MLLKGMDPASHAIATTSTTPTSQTDPAVLVRYERPPKGLSITTRYKGMKSLRRTTLAAIGSAMLALALTVTTAGAAPRPSSGACSIAPSTVSVGQVYVLSATGLPSLSPINLFVTDALGTVGRPLGSTPDGTFALNEASAVAGTTTYQFTGLVRRHTAVYATCSVSVSS